MQQIQSDINRNYLVGKRLRMAREVCGKTIKEVAKQVGVSAQALSMYELGRYTVSSEMFRKLNFIYKMPYEYYMKQLPTDTGFGQVYFRSFSTATATKEGLKKFAPIGCKRNGK